MTDKIFFLLLYFCEFIRIGYTFAIFFMVIIFISRLHNRKFPRLLVLEILNYSLIIYAIVALFVFIAEFFVAGEKSYYEIMNRAFGRYWWSFWIMAISNFIIPHLLWMKPVRKNIWLSLMIMLVILFNQLMIQFVMVFAASHRDYIPMAWHINYLTFGTLVSSMPFVIIYTFIVLVLTYFISKNNDRYTEPAEQNKLIF